jgi:hypothetical protein
MNQKHALVAVLLTLRLGVAAPTSAATDSCRGEPPELFTTIDIPGASFVSASGIGADGDIVGFTFLQLVAHLPIVLFLLWLLARTLPYLPPVIPQ